MCRTWHSGDRRQGAGREKDDVSATWIRVGGGLLAFVVVGLLGVLALRQIDPERAADSWSLVTILAIPAGIAAYALIEYLQTAASSPSRASSTPARWCSCRSPSPSTSSWARPSPAPSRSPSTSTRSARSSWRRWPGRSPAPLTGLLSNLVWTYLAPPPFGSPYAAPFALVAVGHRPAGRHLRALGLAAAAPGPRAASLVVGAVVAIGLVERHGHPGAGRLAGGLARRASLAPGSDDTAFLVLGWLAMLLVLGTVVGLVWSCSRDRDLTAAYVVVAGVVTGITAAVIARPSRPASSAA